MRRWETVQKQGITEGVSTPEGSLAREKRND